MDNGSNDDGWGGAYPWQQVTGAMGPQPASSPTEELPTGFPTGHPPGPSAPRACANPGDEYHGLFKNLFKKKSSSDDDDDDDDDGDRKNFWEALGLKKSSDDDDDDDDEEVTCRTVTGDGPYTYKQCSDGSLYIMKSPTKTYSSGKKVTAGSSSYTAIVGEIGEYSDSSSSSASSAEKAAAVGAGIGAAVSAALPTFLTLFGPTVEEDDEEFTIEASTGPNYLMWGVGGAALVAVSLVAYKALK